MLLKITLTRDEVDKIISRYLFEELEAIPEGFDFSISMHVRDGALSAVEVLASPADSGNTAGDDARKS